MMFPEIINMLVRSKVSLARVRRFLDSEDVKGMGGGGGAALRNDSGDGSAAPQFMNKLNSPLTAKKTLTTDVKRYEN